MRAHVVEVVAPGVACGLLFGERGGGAVFEIVAHVRVHPLVCAVVFGVPRTTADQLDAE